MHNYSNAIIMPLPVPINLYTCLFVQLHVDHEKISVSMLERLLTNPKVLGEFVYEGLKDEHVQLIGHMISPPPLEECDKRLFLYEVLCQVN